VKRSGKLSSLGLTSGNTLVFFFELFCVAVAGKSVEDTS